MIGLIDADLLCYRAAAVSVDSIDWGDGDDPHTVENAVMAEQVVDRLVRDWLKAAKVKKYGLVFSDRSAPRVSFRYDIHPAYKAQRAEEKPPLHDHIYEYLHKHHKTFSYPGLEGDDTLGLMSTSDGGNKFIVISVDKDMMTFPGRIVNPDETDPKVHKVSPAAADYNWMFQTLTGDTVDNYKGAPGVGPVKAREVLAGARTLHEMWERVLCTFACQQDHKRWGQMFTCETAFDEALMNARCARILRHGDYDAKNQTVRLWHPDPDEEEHVYVGTS